MRYVNITFLLFLVINISSFSQVTPQQMVSNMGRGINLGNVLSAPFEGNWGDVVEETYFEDIAAVGFKTVRIPIRFDRHTTELSNVNYTNGNGDYIGSITDYQVETTFLNRVEEVTTWALNHNLIAIIDVHGDKWFWESYKASSEHYKTGNDLLAANDRFRAIWRDISVRFQNTSENVLFEIMNEAYFALSASEANTINSDILSLIRQTNPTRNVIVTGGGNNSWQAPLQLPTSFITSDSYLIATFHYYRPFNFTASAREDKNDFDWGTPAEKATVDTNFNAVQNWAQTNNIPILLGEFGADNEGGYDYRDGTYGNFGGPTIASRALYHSYVAEAAVSRNFAFTVWDAGDKAGKTIYKVLNREWVEDVKNAVLGADLLTISDFNKVAVTVYPNPTQNFIQIKTDQSIKQVSLYDGLGKQINIFSKDNKKLRITNIPAGIYFLKIKTEDNSILTKKVIIKKDTI